MSLQSQLKVGGMGGFIGFDYGFLPQIFLMRQIPLVEQRFLLQKLDIISGVARVMWNKKKE